MSDIVGLLGCGPDVVEPELAGWNAIRAGMSRVEVERLLGLPRFTGEWSGRLMYGYGYVTDILMPVGYPFAYSLSFGPDGKVVDIIEPFGNSDREGAGLSAPEILTPEEHRD